MTYVTLGALPGLEFEELRRRPWPESVPQRQDGRTTGTASASRIYQGRAN